MKRKFQKDVGEILSCFSRGNCFSAIAEFERMRISGAPFNEVDISFIRKKVVAGFLEINDEIERKLRLVDNIFSVGEIFLYEEVLLGMTMLRQVALAVGGLSFFDIDSGDRLDRVNELSSLIRMKSSSLYKKALRVVAK